MFRDIRRQAGKTLVFLRKHWGRIAYYAGIAAALAVVAVAAEQYRADEAQPASPAQAVPATEIEVEAPVQAETGLLKPEGMVLVREYSSNPQWNEALGYWETHGAADYRCEDDEVLSLSDGTVVSVGKSSTYGAYIEVESGDYLLRYASVQPEDGLEPGMPVTAGERLGIADASMPGEGYAGAHLHLEICRERSYVDPEALPDK